MKVELNNKLCAVENEKCPDTWRVSRRNDLVRTTQSNKLNSLLLLYPKWQDLSSYFHIY